MLHKALLAVALCACAPSLDDSAAGESDVVVDTGSPAARAQYDADVAFAQGYTARCTGPVTGHPRVLVTGFGRFLDVTENATGLMASALVPAARYPRTAPPAAGQVDLPAPQTSVGMGTLTLPKMGKVDVCAVILPVHWDVAAIVAAKEIDSWNPSFVLMNGVADDRQTLWLELGSVNQSMSLEDGSGKLVADGKRLISGGETLKGMLLSWQPVEAAARAAVAAHAADSEAGTRFGDLVLGAQLAGFPRSGNTYLCNDVTYVVNWLLGHPGKKATLLQSSKSLAGKQNAVVYGLKRDLHAVPRVFLHWPTTLRGNNVAAGAAVMAQVIDAQLAALLSGPRPSVGSNAQAEIAASGGTF